MRRAISRALTQAAELTPISSGHLTLHALTASIRHQAYIPLAPKFIP